MQTIAHTYIHTTEKSIPKCELWFIIIININNFYGNLCSKAFAKKQKQGINLQQVIELFTQTCEQKL